LNSELESMWEETAYFKVLPGICFVGLKKITENLRQNNRSTDRDLNPEPPKCEDVLLTSHSTATFGEVSCSRYLNESYLSACITSTNDSTGYVIMAQMLLILRKDMGLNRKYTCNM
jgi:hypothetical protein